jgi:hypothetical protein
MDRNIFAATLQAFKKRVPFKPFTITLVTGEQFEIDFPDAYLYRDGLGMYAAPGGVPVIFDNEGVANITGDLKQHEEAA